MGKWFMPNAVCHSHSWEETKRPLIPLFLCLTNETRITSKSKHTVKYPDLPSAMRPVPHSEQLSTPKPLENLAFSDDNSDSDKDHGQQDGEHFDCVWTFEGSCSSIEPHLLTEDNINDLVRDFNLSKKQAELFGSRLKRMESSPPRY
jgi:hypothetical protein